MAGQEQQMKLAADDREDKQGHEKDMKVLDFEGKKELVTLEKSLDGQNKVAQNAAKAAMQPNDVSQY